MGWVQYCLSRLMLVNNFGIGGVVADEVALRAASNSAKEVAAGSQIEWGKILNESYELAVQCVQTNYYVAKRMVERFIPVLESSDSPTIVNVSSSIGKLKVRDPTEMHA
ncbi:putative NAD(P)-binding domain superfamily [Helianthus annuus]|uniref:NAD(P)-binding domain superfamily n=1 Tax=Helianthus annuus TaxID=4232 RepID=A0A9K3I910_HELAN|nr:putative NAD(P)-binding domain superfamily [Helianthus annuus]KAJ0536159.1 putative NAD(P)-binding domain superfamily [Helianthus annuus]